MDTLCLLAQLVKDNLKTNRPELLGNQTVWNISPLEGEINIQPKQNEETRTQNNEERLRNLWDNFKCSNIHIIGVPEEEEEQEIDNQGVKEETFI